MLYNYYGDIMKNIIYFSDINKIGGIESWLYYISKIFGSKYDITVFYQTGDPKQILRLKKYVRCLKWKDEQIECEKAMFCYDLNIIDKINAKEYVQFLHGDYEALKVKPNTHPKINKYYAVSEVVKNSFEKLTGKKVEVIYNPIALDKPKKLLKLISATRLTKEKGKHRIEKLAKILDENNINYLWTIFTDDTNAINNPNIIYIKPKLDISSYIVNNDYLVQLSDSEGYCYSAVEALSLGIPVIATDMPVLKEIGLENEKNGYILDFDLKNVDVNKIYNNIPKNFNYKIINSNFEEVLVKGKPDYKPLKDNKVELKCIKKFYDIDNKCDRNINDIFQVNLNRALCLLGDNENNIVVCELI